MYDSDTHTHTHTHTHRQTDMDAHHPYRHINAQKFSHTHIHTHTPLTPTSMSAAAFAPGVTEKVDDSSISFLFLFPGHLRLHSVSRVGTHVQNIHYVSAADSIYTQFVYTFMALLCVCV